MPACLLPSTWPRITAGPISPGVGPSLYQPACIGVLTGGTSIVWSALSPSCTSDEGAPILGMSTDTGVEAASDGTPAAAALVAVVVDVAAVLVVTAGTDCGGVVPHAPTSSPAASSAPIRV